MFWVVPCHSVAALDTLQKIGIEVHLMHKFMPLDLFLVFCSKHAQSTIFGLKRMFSMVSRHFIIAPDPLRKLVYASETISCLVATNVLNPGL